MQSTARLRLRNDAASLNVMEWRERARRAIPSMAWSYVEGGADDLVTLAANISAFGAWRLRQRILTNVSAPDLAITMVGKRLAMPLALAPTGAAGVSHWTGDIAVARAAEAAGTRVALSSASSYLLEEVAAATAQNHWFQLYTVGGRERTADLISRARRAGYSALFVTVDSPMLGNREAERRWPLQTPWTITPSRFAHMVRHWRWVRDALVHKRLAAVHFLDKPGVQASDAPRDRRAHAVADALASAEALRREVFGALNWNDLRWIRDQWHGPLYVKGVLDPDDAARVVDEIGAQGVVVSNHGGRQLDRSLASIEALPAIVDRIGDRSEVLLDGGVRRGADVVIALCLGARGVFIGRPYLYGLAAAGEAGVGAVLNIFTEEIRRTMVLMGCPGVADLDRSWLMPANDHGPLRPTHLMPNSTDHGHRATVQKGIC